MYMNDRSKYISIFVYIIVYKYTLLQYIPQNINYCMDCIPKKLHIYMRIFKRFCDIH